MKRWILWLAAALGLGAIWRRHDNRPTGASRAEGRAKRLLPVFSAIALGAAEAWRTAAREHALRQRRGPLAATGWRGGEAAGMALAPNVAPLRTPSPPAAAPEATEACPDPTGKRDLVEATQRAADEPNALLRWWLYLKLLIQRFGRDQCPIFAASLSFFGLLSIVPILLVAIAALGYVIEPDEARKQILNFVQQMLPGRAARVAAQQLMEQVQFENQVRVLMEQRGVAGVIGLLSLIWAAMQIFVSSVPAMNAAWEVPETRNWLKLRLVAVGLLLGAGSLFLLSLLPSSGPDFVRRLNIPGLGLPEHVPVWVEWVFVLVAVAINCAMFTVIYRFLPAAPVTWKQAAVGGVTMGVMWELAKQAFSLYLATMGDRNPMYGALGGVVTMILWIYYTSMLLLMGAEVAKLYRDVEETKSRRAPSHS